MIVNRQGQRLPEVTDEAIKGFFGEYRFLSNFEVLKKPIYVFSNGVEYIYWSSEAAYMSFKSDDPAFKAALEEVPTPGAAKRLGRSVELVSDWSNGVRDMAMYEAVYAKFENNLELKQKLIDTSQKLLVETNNWGDTYWGECAGIGQNNLGKTLMRVRQELMSESINNL